MKDMIPDKPGKVLTPSETRTLAAMADRIFPKTDTPGAMEIGVLNYIDIALTGDYAALAPLYRLGLRAVNRFARAKFAKRFPDLNEEQKDAVLGRPRRRGDGSGASEDPRHHLGVDLVFRAAEGDDRDGRRRRLTHRALAAPPRARRA